jgi:hypothetical protein
VGKEVIFVSYEKPEIVPQNSAIDAVRATLQKAAPPTEADDMTTVGAYEADEA